ncbi:MAG: hypothetical protein U0641_18155 [Anaerolineae bacterium]
MFMGSLAMAGVEPGQMMALLNRAGSAIMDIVHHPGKFLGNVLKALGQGFRQFWGNIQKHLLAGLISWLFGAVAEAGIQLPKDFSLKSILSLVLQVLGLTGDAIKARITSLVGERNMRVIEKVWQYVSKFMSEGLGGLWELLKDQLANLKDMLLGMVKDWLIMEIIQAAVMKVLAMFNPVSGLIAIIKMIYNVIKFLIEQAQRIKALFAAIAGSVVELITGNIQGAANKVEMALANLVPIAIGFLASLLGIGGIAHKVRDIIQKLRAPVDKALNFVLGGLAKGLRKLGVTKLLDKGKAGLEWGKKKVQQGVAYVKSKATQGIKGVNERLGLGKGKQRGSDEEKRQHRQERAFAAAAATLDRYLARGASLLTIRAVARYLRLRYRFHTMRVEDGDREVLVQAGFSPAKELTKAQRQAIEKALDAAKKLPGVLAAVQLRRLRRSRTTIGELANEQQREELKDIVERGLRASRRAYAKRDVREMVHRVLRARITVLTGTKALRMLYRDLYLEQFEKARGEIHHLIPLYLGGSHETVNLLALAPKLHKRMHALFRDIGAKKRFSLSWAALRARFGGKEQWVIAIIREDGRIEYKEVKFTK